jgi:hypothetical protein
MAHEAFNQNVLELAGISGELSFLATLLENCDSDTAFESERDTLSACGRVLKRYGDRLADISCILNELDFV